MGSFTVGCLIKNHVDREKTVRIPQLLVDTGSEATWIPQKLLTEIGVKPEKRSIFQLANGHNIYRDVGYAIIRVNDSETTDEVVFAEKGDLILLGARALEGLMLWIDAKGKRLVTLDSHPVAKVVVPGPVSPDKDKYFKVGAIIQGKGGPMPFVVDDPEPKARRKKSR
jgi:predicted aspartyl protease